MTVNFGLFTFIKNNVLRKVEMQKKQRANAEPEGTPSFEAIIRDWIGSEFLSKFGKRVGIILVVIAVAVSAFLYQRKSTKSKTYARNKQLGKAYVYYSHNKMDSAEIFLKSFVASSQAQLVQSKAYLLLGQTQYFFKKYDEALDSYKKVKGSPTGQSLITSGALHGMAACYMQIKEYQKAVEALEEFIETYMRRTGNLNDRSAGREPRDLSPAVPNVLWKLALCCKQINAPEKARDACDKLISIYADTEEAAKAARLLISI